MLLASLSASLLHMDVSNGEEVVTAATTVVKGVSGVLEYVHIVGIVPVASSPSNSTDAEVNLFHLSCWCSVPFLITGF